MKQPPRLLDDPALAPELRADLKRVAGAQPSYDTATGLVALQAAIASTAASTAAGTAGGGAAGKAASAALTLKIAIATVTTAVVVAGATALWPKPASVPVHAPAKPAAPAKVAPPPQPPVEAPVAPVQEAEPTREPSTTLPEPSVAPAPAVRAHDTHAPAARDDDAELRREIAQLGRIKVLLERDPNAAARLAIEGDREFRRGMLRQERGALAIFALWNAGRHAEATRRAQVFIERYPDSPSRARIERMLSGQE